MRAFRPASGRRAQASRTAAARGQPPCRCAAEGGGPPAAAARVYVRAPGARFLADHRFFTWLYRIGVNEAKRILERRPTTGTVVSVEDRPVDDVADDSSDVHARLEAAELRDVLERAIRRLPENYRAAVVLRDIERISTAEAAGILGLREAALKSRLHRGRMTLRADVARYVGEDDRAPVRRDRSELS